MSVFYSHLIHLFFSAMLVLYSHSFISKLKVSFMPSFGHTRDVPPSDSFCPLTCMLCDVDMGSLYQRETWIIDTDGERGGTTMLVSSLLFFICVGVVLMMLMMMIHPSRVFKLLLPMPLECPR